MWAKVENGKIVSTRASLPKSYKNVSGFDKLDEKDLEKFGYHKVEEQKRTLKQNEIIEKHELKFENKKVVKTPIVKKQVKESAEDIKARQEYDKHIYNVECLELANKVLIMTDHCLLEDAPYSKADIDKFKAMRLKLYEMYSDSDKIYEGLKEKLQSFKDQSRSKLIQPIEI